MACPWSSTIRGLMRCCYGFSEKRPGGVLEEPASKRQVGGALRIVAARAGVMSTSL